MSKTIRSDNRNSRSAPPLSSSQAMALVLGLLAATIAAVASALLAAILGAGTRVFSAILLFPIASTLVLAFFVVSSHRAYRRELAARSRSSELEAGLFDSDTGTFGPRYVEFAFRREIALAHRSQAPLTLMSVSFDFDRTLGDHGPVAADHLVHVTAQILRTALRGSDVICRYNRGEFVVLMPDTDLGQSDVPCRRILHAAAQWNSTTRMRYRLSLKVGIGDGWEGLSQALRDSRLASSPVAPPPFTNVGYVPRSSAVN